MKKILLSITAMSIVPLFLACSTMTTASERQALDMEIAGLKQELAKQKTDEDQEIAKAKETYDKLAASLKDEIQKDKISIDQYRGVLTINIADEIFFDSGKAAIKKDSYDVLNRIGKIVKNLTDKEIEIQGHTDSVPIAETYRYKYPNNWYLGAARAVNVAVYFEDKLKIDPSRLEVLSFSKFRPLVPNTTPANKAKNRRIEIVLVDKSLYRMMETKRGVN